MVDILSMAGGFAWARGALNSQNRRPLVRAVSRLMAEMSQGHGMIADVEEVLFPAHRRPAEVGVDVNVILKQPCILH
jgi:hypothetical protein